MSQILTLFSQGSIAKSVCCPLDLCYSRELEAKRLLSLKHWLSGYLVLGKYSSLSKIILQLILLKSFIWITFSIFQVALHCLTVTLPSLKLSPILTSLLLDLGVHTKEIVYLIDSTPNYKAQYIRYVSDIASIIVFTYFINLINQIFFYERSPHVITIGL